MDAGDPVQGLTAKVRGDMGLRDLKHVDGSTLGVGPRRWNDPGSSERVS